MDPESGHDSNRLEPRHQLLLGMRRSGDEVQLTNAIAAVGAVERTFASGFARALLAAVAPRRGTAAKRAARLLAALPEELDFATQNPAEKKRPRWLFASGRQGRIDWVLRDRLASFELRVEVKVGEQLTKAQLLAYLPSPAERPRRFGLIALTRDVPGASDIGAELDSDWLGIVRWDELLPRVVGLHIEDQELARQWPLFLDVIAQAGDVGVEPLDWESLAREARTGQAAVRNERLLAVASDLALDELRRLVQRRLAKPREQAALAERQTARRQGWAELRFRVPTDNPDYAIAFRLTGAALPLVLRTEFLPLESPGRLRRRATHEWGAALANLERAGFSPERGSVNLTRTQEITGGEKDPAGTLASMIRADLSAIVRSGALDRDLG